jgi:PiT family inorganic phosphate transporter
MLALLPGLYLGWGVGANDAANTFGPQIGANVISYRRAIVLAAIFTFLGALIEGQKVFGVLGRLTPLSLEMSVVAALSAAVVVNVVTLYGIPISTSHATFGALVAVGLIQRTGFHGPSLVRLASSMVTAPLGAGLVAYLLYRAVASLSAGRMGGTLAFQQTVRVAGVLVGCYAAYALGSNNVGNAMAPFVAVGLVSPRAGAVLGGLAIAVGVLTFSRRVIVLVGKQITALDPASALVAAAATALTTHVFTQIGVPVSTSQAIVGAVAGVGLTKGMVAINRRMFWVIPVSWVVSMLASAVIAWVLFEAHALVR